MRLVLLNYDGDVLNSWNLEEYDLSKPIARADLLNDILESVDQGE